MRAAQGGIADALTRLARAAYQQGYRHGTEDASRPVGTEPISPTEQPTSVSRDDLMRVPRDRPGDSVGPK